MVIESDTGLGIDGNRPGRLGAAAENAATDGDIANLIHEESARSAGRALAGRGAGVAACA